jgi:hypothetical protein
VSHTAELSRKKLAAEQAHTIAEASLRLKLEELRAEAETTVKRFEAAQAGFSEALLALGNQETLQKVAEAMSVQNLIGGRSFTEVLGKLFDGSPVQAVLEKVINRGTPLTVGKPETTAKGNNSAKK